MTGTVTIVERWGAAGAPEKKLEEIRTAYDGYFEQIERRFGITRAAYLIAAREALIDCRALIEGKVFSRPRSKSGKREACLARWSRILDSVRAVLSHFGRVGWTVFWSAIRKLQDVFGVNERGSWERLRILQDIGWLVVWHRWDGKEHTYEEGRSNVYFLRVPEEIWEAWVATPKAQKTLAGLARSDNTTSGAPPSAGLKSPPVSVSPPAASSRPRPSSTRQPASPAPSAAAPSETVHWFPALFHALRAKLYSSDGGTSRHVATIEQYFEEDAAALHAKCLQQGLGEEQLLRVPAPPAIARELATAASHHWLRDPGKEGAMLRKEHPIGCFALNARQLSTAAAAAWWTEWLKANPPPPVLLAEPVVHRAPVSVSLSLAAAVPPIDQPSQRRPVLRRGPLSEREAEEWARCQAAEAAELAATQAGEVDGNGLADDELDELDELAAAQDLDGDFDTLLSAVDPVPD